MLESSFQLVGAKESWQTTRQCLGRTLQAGQITEQGMVPEVTTFSEDYERFVNLEIMSRLPSSSAFHRKERIEHVWIRQIEPMVDEKLSV